MDTGLIGAITTLKTQEDIRILFIILNVFAWLADKNIEDSVTNKTSNNLKLSRDIYIVILIISILITAYYWYINYKGLEENNNNNTFNIRNIAYIISIVSLLMLLYVQITDTSLLVEETAIL